MQLALGSSIATRSYSDPELAAAYDRARELCEHLGNDDRVGQTLGGLSIFYINRGEILVGAELAERVLTIAEATATICSKYWAGCSSAWPAAARGATESLELATRALAIYHPERHQVLGHRFGTDQGVAAHVFAGWSHLLLGHLDRGLAQLIAAVDLAEPSASRSIGYLPSLSWPPDTGNGGRRPRPSTSPNGLGTWLRSRDSPSGPVSAACGRRPSG